ncbi:GTPase-activating protein gyp8 [Rhizina undulata]
MVTETPPEVKLETISDDALDPDIKSENPPQPFKTTARAVTEEELKKIESINQACRAGDRAAVVELAISTDGLISDEARRTAWPFLLGYNHQICNGEDDKNKCLIDPQGLLSWENLPPHGDENQVQLDVNRSFIYYPTNMSPRELKERKRELSKLIVEVLRRHPMLCYFQGFHDICQVLLLVLGPANAVKAVEHIALLRIRDFMLPSMSPALDHLRLLYPLLYSADAKLCAHLSRTQPFFALAATLTLYAHEIQEYSDIARLFDVLLAMDPVFSLYLFAQVVLQRKDELFDIPDDEPEMLHSILSKLPKPLDLEGLISGAIILYEKYPPESLSTWGLISRKSVLKTLRLYKVSNSKTTIKRTSLKEAEDLFNKQSRELDHAKWRKEMLEAMMKYKGPATALGIALIVGISAVGLGFYMRRNGGSIDIDIERISSLLSFYSAPLRRMLALA